MEREHLTEHELDACVEGRTDPALDRHLAECAECGRRLDRYIEWLRQLPSLSMQQRGPQTISCRNGEYWAQAALGFIPTEESERALAHASQCARCGPLLRQATESLSDDLTDEDAAILDSLQTSTPEWQESIARRAAGSSKSMWRTILVCAAVGVLSAGASLWWISSQRALSRVSALIAEAYAEHRTTELRILGAPHSPVSITRGNDADLFSRPATLLQAEITIRERLARNRKDAPWLDLAGRVELVEGDAEKAVQSLETAGKLAPNDPIILADLGVAYARRAEIGARPADYMSAIEKFGRSLQLKPGVPEVIFNHAIALERLRLYLQAKAEWESYLSVDPSGAWADEARVHLAEIAKKKL